MSRPVDVELHVTDLFDVPDDKMLVGDEILDPQWHRCCIECGSLCRTTSSSCFNCGSDFTMREEYPSHDAR